jgi:hypothetical protein
MKKEGNAVHTVHAVELEQTVFGDVLLQVRQALLDATPADG